MQSLRFGVRVHSCHTAQARFPHWCLAELESHLCDRSRAIGHRPSKKPTEAPLGTGIFDVDQAVLDYIVNQIEMTAERH